MVRADLHFHPGEFRPVNPGETRVSIEPILKAIFEEEIGILALTSCHDRRWDYYAGKARKLKGWKYYEDSKRRVFSLRGNIVQIYFLDGQEIKGEDGDINIICPGIVLEHEPYTKRVEDLAKEGKDLGALVSLAHPFSRNGLLKSKKGSEIAQRMIEQKVLDFIEIWDALSLMKKDNKKSIAWYKAQRESAEKFYTTLNCSVQQILAFPQAISVSDAHLDRNLGTGNTEFDIEAEGLNVENVFDRLGQAKVGKLHYGSIGFVSKLNYSLSLARAIGRDKLASFIS